MRWADEDVPLENTGELPPAVNQYETILRRQPRCLEALVSLASIHTHLAFTYRSSSDSLAARKKAKELFDQILRLFASGKEGGAGKEGEGVNKYVAKSERVREVARDGEMFVEIARVWSDEGVGERSLTAYLEARRIKQEEADDQGQGQGQGPSAQLLNNIGVLQFQQGHLDAALQSFESALMEISTVIAQADGVVGEKMDAVLMPCTFNRGVVLEAMGETETAKECYEQILQRHSEYVEGEFCFLLLCKVEERLTSTPNSQSTTGSHRSLDSRLLPQRSARRRPRSHQRRTHLPAEPSRASSALHLLPHRDQLTQDGPRLHPHHAQGLQPPRRVRSLRCWVVHLPRREGD